MRKRLLLAILVTAVVTATTTAAIVTAHHGSPAPDEHVVASVMRSKVLAEQRDVMVHLPDSYGREASQRYPVLYVLDGPSQAGHTAASARLMARIGVMPEIIVVSAPGGETRQRDYTPPSMRADLEEPNGPMGQADRFLQFIERELIPYVERTYRTTSTRMLAGNSRGGLFVVYSLIEKPELFQARFAYSPALWREDDRIVMELERSLKTRPATPAFIYLSLGDRENEKMNGAFQKALVVMRQSAGPALRWKADVTSGADHWNNAVLSTPVGLREYYRVDSAYR